MINTGDRVSICFKNGSQESVTLFHHWGGMEFPVQVVREYCLQLKAELMEAKRGGCYPIDRLEPQTLMVDFVRWYTKDSGRVKSNLYFGVDSNDGDNSDNGHFVIVCEGASLANMNAEPTFTCYGPCEMWSI